MSNTDNHLNLGAFQSVGIDLILRVNGSIDLAQLQARYKTAWEQARRDQQPPPAARYSPTSWN